MNIDVYSACCIHIPELQLSVPPHTTILLSNGACGKSPCCVDKRQYCAQETTTFKRIVATAKYSSIHTMQHHLHMNITLVTHIQTSSSLYISLVVVVVTEMIAVVTTTSTDERKKCDDCMTWYCV